VAVERGIEIISEASAIFRRHENAASRNSVVEGSGYRQLFDMITISCAGCAVKIAGDLPFVRREGGASPPCMVRRIRAHPLWMLDTIKKRSSSWADARRLIRPAPFPHLFGETDPRTQNRL